MTRPDSQRETVRGYLERLIDVGARPHEVFEQARAMWLSGSWPGPGEPGYDPVAHDVLFLLADARRLGVSHEDAPVLMQYLDQAAADAGASHGLLEMHFGSVDPSAREALQESDDYYGTQPLQPEVDDLEIGLASPERRRLHKGVRLDPESVWPDVRALLCDEGDPFDHFRVDLIEDLMYHHGDAFIDQSRRSSRNAHPRQRRSLGLRSVAAPDLPSIASTRSRRACSASSRPTRASNPLVTDQT